MVKRDNKATTSPEGLNYKKKKSLIEVDSEECHNAVETDLPIAKKRSRCEVTNSRAMGIIVSWYQRGKTFVESSIPCSPGGRVIGRERGRGGEEYKSKLQVSIQD